MLAVLAAPVFVLMWSTGFVVARAAIVDADPQVFLLVRMALVAMLMAAWGLARRDHWPHGRRAALHVIAGALLPGLYLCGGWWAIGDGMPAGIMALLGGLQPLAIALLSASLIGERLSGRTMIGLAVGTIGVALVLGPAIGRGAGATTPAAAIVGVLAVAAMAGSTMIQRAKLARDALAPAIALQNVGGTIVAALAVPAAGHWRWHDTTTLWVTLAWSVLLLSAVSLTLLAWMLRHQGAARVSALLLLVPPLAAIEAWWLFDETLVPLQLAGFALALGGVLLARAPERTPAEPEPG